MSPLDTKPMRRPKGGTTVLIPPLTRARAGGCPPVAEQALVSSGEVNSPADFF